MIEPSDPAVQSIVPAAPVAPGEPAGGKKAKLPENTEAMPWPSDHEIKKESNPFNDPDWRMFAYAWAGLFIRVILIVGAIFSVYQYLENAKEKRISKTFELLEEWEKPEYLATQIAVRQRVEEYIKANPPGLGPKATPKDYAFNRSETGRAIMAESDPKFELEFDRVVAFLNRVSSCVLSNQCARELTDDYFRDFATTFWSYFGDYSKDVRKRGSTTFSVPLEEYLTGERPRLKQAPTPDAK